VVYALALAGCLVGLTMWHSWFGGGLSERFTMASWIWTTHQLTANCREIAILIHLLKQPTPRGKYQSNTPDAPITAF